MVGAAEAAPAQETCLALRERRDDLAQQAMKEEIALVRRIRDRICPELHRRAEGANANAPAEDTITVPGKTVPFDYEAFIACRQKAEAVLERTHRVLFRNRLGFTYYTPSGADLARRAERASVELHGLGCWPGTGQV